jgi:hypothetical protein
MSSRNGVAPKNIVWLFAALLPAFLLVSGCLTPNFKLPTGVGGAGGEGNAHCYDETSNADETGVDCGGLECDGCEVGGRCRKDSDCESNSCGGGKCKKATCDDLKVNNDETGPDCGGKTCETRCDVTLGCSVTRDCLAPPAEADGAAQCVENEDGEKECRLSCSRLRGDCNESASDGCEEQTETSSTHCGGCFQRCDLPNVAEALCVSGQCKVDAEDDNGGCESGFHDCDGVPENGCEANFETDVDNCGGCNQACSEENGTAECVLGECRISCKSGFANCNDDARSDGCETDTRSSVNDCGGCGEEDPKYICKPMEEGWSPYCLDKECGSINCEEIAPGYGACRGDRRCDVPLNTVTNCGVCGQICVVTGGTPTCTNKRCEIGACDEQRRDCDLVYMNGCEVDVTTDKRHCGGCTTADESPGTGQDCTALEANEALHILATSCEGFCKITSCDQGFGDCDGDPMNGCEVNFATDDKHCGACTASDAQPGAGENCDSLWSHADGSCVEGACVFEGCDTSFEDCSGDESCETDLRLPTSCGACGVECGGDQTRTSGTPSCTESGQCQVSCEAGYCNDATDPERPCTKRIGVGVENCEVCGESCQGSLPFCDGALGCRQAFPVTVVGTPTTRSGVDGVLSTSFTLTNPSTTRGRAVVVAIATPRAIASVTLGGTNMTRAAATTGTGDIGYSYVYYLPSSLLGSPGTKTLQISAISAWGGIVATPVEVINMAQGAPNWTSTSYAGNGPCSAAGGTHRVRQTFDVEFQGSLVFSALTVYGGSNGSTATATNLGTVYSGRQLGQQGQGWMSLTQAPSTNDVAVGWDVSGGDCWSVATANAVFDPIVEDGASD